MTADSLIKELKQKKNIKKRQILERFFKTGKGEYGEGDVFLGIAVPETRKISKKYITLPLSEIQKLLDSKFHEVRLAGIFVLVSKYVKANDSVRKKLIDFYLLNTHNINNWDLVDSSAYKILGNYLLNKNRDILYKLAKSKSLWERRIAIISTFEFINNGEHKDVFKICKILINDDHDLIHKACGWMLREVGKRISIKIEKEFLDQYYRKMPRTMLRYAIEKFSLDKKKYYLKKK